MRARAAAVAEHIAAQPGWVTVVGTQPTGRKLRETWHEVVEDLAGRYVDARAEQELQREADIALDRAAEARALPTTPRAISWRGPVRRLGPGSTRCWPTPRPGAAAGLV